MFYILQKITQHKPRITPKRIVGGGLLLGVSFGLTALLLPVVVARTVVFSYQGETCSNTLTLLPSSYQTSASNGFRAEFRDIVKLGSVNVAAKKLCFVPTTLPKQGQANIAVIPFGVGALKRVYTMQVLPAPSASMVAFEKPVGTIATVVLPLSSSDAVFNYTLKVGTRSSVCKKQSRGLQCPLAPLQLDQSSTYSAELSRSLGKSSAVVARKAIQTISAVKLSSPVAPSSTVYSIPTEFQLAANKPLKHVDAVLAKKGTTTPIPTKIITQGAATRLVLAAPLPRETDYTITVKQAIGEDSSGLEAPYVLDFRLGGGPKVSSVSVGTFGVAQNAVIELTFDQPVANQNFANLVSVEGAEARVVATGQKATITLLRAPLCQRFTIKVAAGLVNPSGVKNEQAWSRASRVTCHTTATYGTSLKGKPLVAHYFGASGPITMYVGAIHGNEKSSYQLMQQWLAELEANPDRYEGKRVVVVPVINPDGLAANTRNNARNVNLNRNFPTNDWKSDINDTNGAIVGGGGTAPLSEPEAQALAHLTTSLKPRLLLSFHSAGSLVIGDVSDGSAPYAATFAKLSRFRNATGNSGTFDYEISGCYEDWASRFAGIPSLVIELESHGSTSFVRHKAALWAML